MKKLLAVALLALSFSAVASKPVAAAWDGARPKTQVTVSPGSATGTFDVSATITDTRTGTMLAEPRMVVRAGVPAQLQIGKPEAEGGPLVNFTVTVADSGENATYLLEVHANGEVVSNRGTIVLRR